MQPARAPKSSTLSGDRVRPSRPLQAAVASDSLRAITFMQRLDGTPCATARRCRNTTPGAQRVCQVAAWCRGTIAARGRQETSVGWSVCMQVVPQARTRIIR